MMKIKKFNDYYVLRLQKGEEIMSTLKAAAQNKKIKGAFFFGLGVGKDLVLGYFDAHKQSYVKKAFQGEYEFTSLLGNITKLEYDTVVHCHATVTDENFQAYGGHLFQGIVPATCEIMVFPFRKILRRKKDKETGLNLISV
ncbi:MAG: DNA-binding protein [candidate division WOR-3 bacterium]|nr:MAG: DNA-binding protein [candidate division WOR-3 bacterium]